MTARRCWRTAALVMLIVITSACAQQAEEQTPAQRNIGGKVEVAAVWSAAEEEAFKKVLAEFTKRTGTTVTFTSTGDKVATVLRTRIAGGSPPELAVLPQPGLMSDLVKQRALQPIGDIVGDQVEESWADSWRTSGSVGNTLYGLFFKGSNKSLVWYSVPSFKSAGVDVPETWNDFLQAARTVRDSGTTPVAVGGQDGWTLTDWFENIYIRTAGTSNYDKLAKHEIPWTDASVTKALGIFGQLLRERSLLYQDPTTVSFEQSVDAVLGKPPKAAMVFEGDFVPGVTPAAKAATPATDYDVFPFPSVEDSEPVVVGGGDMVVMLKNTAQSRALLEFLATADAAEIWAREGGFSSPNKDVDESAYPNEIARKTATALATTGEFRFDLSDQVPTVLGGDVPGSAWSILQDFAKNPSNPNATAQRLEAVARKAYG